MAPCRRPRGRWHKLQMVQIAFRNFIESCSQTRLSRCAMRLSESPASKCAKRLQRSKRRRARWLKHLRRAPWCRFSYLPVVCRPVPGAELDQESHYKRSRFMDVETSRGSRTKAARERFETAAE